MSALFNKYFQDIRFNIILVNNFRIGSFFPYKDKLPKSMQSSLIYKFSCAQCVSEYVGSTTRALYMRIAEHASKSHHTNNPLSSPPYSSIRDHAEQNGSPITIDQFSKLNSTKNAHDLRILESIYIHKLKPPEQYASSYPFVHSNKIACQ